MKRTRPARLATLAALTILIPLTPLTLGGSAAAAPSPLTIHNPGFEEGTVGWTVTAGAGVASSQPHGGTKMAYLDEGGGKEVSQKIKAPSAGMYDFSAWVATGGAGGKFVARVNGETAGSVDLPSRSTYARHTLSRIALKSGDELELAFESGDRWVNADDLMVSPSAPVDPVVTSSDPKIVEMFDWSKRKANSWVQQPGINGPLNVDEFNLTGTGVGVYAPSYWAGYANRSAYYARDMAHQASGASVLGLNDENKEMLSTFAKSSTEEHGYFPVWAFNFDNKTYLSIDYHNPNSFVREVPAPFELVERANDAYRWSGDRSYVDDSTLWDFYRHTTKEFIERHDGTKPNGVAEGTGKGIFDGAASYNETSGEPVAEAGDAIASQYQAFRAMAALARSKGDNALAKRSEEKANKLKKYFNSQWSGSGSGADMVYAYTTDGKPLTGWAKETSWFMPMKQILDPGPRAEAYLDYIDEQSSGSAKPHNIEAYTYLPDTFFAYERNDTAWKWMRQVYDRRNEQHVNSKQGPNGDYPEVSFTMVGQTIEGLMGVKPDAPTTSLATGSRLPSGMDWLQIKDIKIGGNTFTLRHDGTTKSTLTNNTGTDTYTWEARFPGKHTTIKINGKGHPAKTKQINGKTYSYTTAPVAPGQTVTAETSQ